MSNLTLFETILLVLCAVLIAALAAILWWHLAGDRVKALIAGWMALPLFWRLVLPVVFGAFVLHGSVKRGEVVELNVLPGASRVSADHNVNNFNALPVKKIVVSRFKRKLPS